MASKKCFFFDKNNFVYTGTGIAQANPEQKGKYLINPKDRTLVVPTGMINEEADKYGMVLSGIIPVFDKENEVWVQYTDNRTSASAKNVFVDTENKIVRNKTVSELINEGLITIDKYQEVVDEEIVFKSFNTLLTEETITEEQFQGIIVKRKRALRDSELRVVLNDISQYQNERESVSLGILSSTTITEDEYKGLLTKRESLCNFQGAIDYEVCKGDLISNNEVYALTAE